MATTHEAAEYFAWKSQGSNESSIYTRPFGLLERCFYWDARLEGTADVYQSSLIRVRPGTDPRSIFSQNQVHAAWVHTKRVHPLVGARIVVDEETGTLPSFVVEEEKLGKVGEGEVFFHDVANPDEVQSIVDNLITAIPRPMSASQTTRMHIMFCNDGSNTIHVVSFAAHCIMDGIGNGCLLATFLDALTSDLARKVVPGLERQLKVALPVDAVSPVQKLSPARRRWKLGIAAVISQIRAQIIQGGHPLPRKYTTTTHYTPASSQGMHLDLPPAISTTVIQSCRRLGVTYGNAFYVILQVALSRLLLRAHRRGEIPDEEWEFRKRQPMLTGGPLNMRPFLDKEWFESGGKEAVCISIGFLMLKLPFIPLGSASLKPASEGEATWDEFLSMERFVLRTRGVRSQMAQQLKHPLFHEIGNAKLASTIITTPHQLSQQCSPLAQLPSQQPHLLHPHQLPLHRPRHPARLHRTPYPITASAHLSAATAATVEATPQTALSSERAARTPTCSRCSSSLLFVM